MSKHFPLKLHVLFQHTSNFCSHLIPKKIGDEQLHVKLLTDWLAIITSVHVPLFWHGLAEQALTSVSHESPLINQKKTIELLIWKKNVESTINWYLCSIVDIYNKIYLHHSYYKHLCLNSLISNLTCLVQAMLINSVIILDLILLTEL